MFDELWKVKYFQEITGLKSFISKILLRYKMFEKSSKSRGVFRNQASLYNVAFSLIYLTAYFFTIKDSS